MSSSTQSPNTNSKYWMVAVAVFFLGWVFIYAGRSLLSPVMAEIGATYDITLTAVGGVVSLFFLAYTGLQVPSGIIGDKIGRKRVLVIGFMIYALFVGLVYFANTYALFVIIWMIAGAAQGSYYGPQYALSSEAIPPKHLAVGSAIIGAGMSFGIALGYEVSSSSFKAGNDWRMAFVYMAIPIFITALLILFFIKEKVNNGNTAQVATEKKKNITFADFASLFKRRNLLMAYIAIFCSIYGFFVIITWLPTYLETERGMDKAVASRVASIVPWLSIIGTIFFSWVSDRLGKRKAVALFMLPLSLLSIFGIVYSGNLDNSTTTSTILGLATNPQNILLLCVLVLYGFIGKISLNPVLLALTAENVPKSLLSTAFGLYNFLGMCGSILAPWMTGFIATKTGNLNASFYVAAAVTVIGIIALLFVDESKNLNKRTA